MYIHTYIHTNVHTYIHTYNIYTYMYIHTGWIYAKLTTFLLKLRLIEDPSGPGVPPLAVTCRDVTKKEAFQQRHKGVYQYEVLGWLHGAKARQALLSEHPEEAESMPVSIALCIVV